MDVAMVVLGRRVHGLVRILEAREAEAGECGSGKDCIAWSRFGCVL